MMSGAEVAPANERRRGPLLRALLGVFAGVTIGWVVSALFIPGDYLNLAEPRPIVCIGLGALLGAYAGARVRARWQHVLMLVLVALCAAFWVLAPSGWWAS